MAYPPYPSMASAPYPSVASPPTVSLSELSKEFRQAYDLMVAFFALLCYGYFSFLVGLDVWRAFKKRSTWLPGKAFALTGVTVQIIVWWTSIGKLFRNLNVEIDEATLYIGFSQIVVSGRVAVCVFVGYLLPEMSATSVRAFLTLGTAIGLQIVSELVFFSEKKRYKRLYRGEANDLMNWAALVDKIILSCVIGLGLILGCTVLAIKNIRGLLRQRISTVLSVPEEDEIQSSVMSWSNFEDEVLRSWLIARIWRPDYVIARSVFSSGVGVLVSICVILSILSNTWHNIVFNDSNKEIIYVFVPLFSFIIVGWVFISWRWWAAQLCFRGKDKDGGHNWKRHFSMEDFWTSNTVALIHMYDLKRDREQFQDDERSSSMKSMLRKLKSLPAKMFSKVRLRKLLYLVLILQKGVVFFSKVCGFLSHVIVGKHVMLKGGLAQPPEKYANDLKCICLPGEDPSDLWVANKMAFKEVEHLIKNGRDKSMSSTEINSIFGRCSLQWAKDGTQLLSMIQLPSFPVVQIHYMQMTVVSLITIFIKLHNAKSDRLGKALKACGEVWDLLSFADDCHIDLQANEISLLAEFNRGKVEVCIAAEREFYKLRNEYEELSAVSEYTNGKDAVSTLQGLSKRCNDLLKGENLSKDSQIEVSANLCDSKDWPKIVLSDTIYKLCIEMLKSKDVPGFDFVAWTDEALSNVIACSMSRLPNIFVKQCWKWAQEYEEDKLWEVSHLVGKCRGMMEAWGLKPKEIMNTTKEWTIQVMESTDCAADL